MIDFDFEAFIRKYDLICSDLLIEQIVKAFTDFHEAYYFCKTYGRINELERYILSNNNNNEGNDDYLFIITLIDYARDVIKGRWPEAEILIAKTNLFDLYNGTIYVLENDIHITLLLKKYYLNPHLDQELVSAFGNPTRAVNFYKEYIFTDDNDGCPELEPVIRKNNQSFDRYLYIKESFKLR